LRVLFATIDPARDTPEVLRQYLAAFDANFIGLYAEPAAMAPLLRSLGAVAARENLPQGAYTMNHSATLYLLDTHGSLAAVFTPPYSAAVLRSDLQRVAQAAVL
jgi:protein SCO1/2